jgi:hypothetical protein
MQMELLKKPIRSYRTIEIRETEEMLENSIIVPDSKPDIKDILLADAECYVTSVEKSGRMIEVGGEIRYRVLYCSDTPEPKPENMIAHFTWSFSVPKPKAEGEIGVFARCRCQHTEASIINGRKILVRTVIALICRFYEIKSDEIGREILGENVYLKTTPVNVVTLKENSDITAKVSNILSLPHGSPAIKEILFSRINLGPAELTYKDDDPCLEAKGTAYVLYRSDTMDESIESVVLEFPVKTTTGIRTGNDGVVLASNVLKKWEIEPIEDNDGLNTQLSVNLEIDVDAQSLGFEEQTIIEDAYSTDYRLDLKRNPVNLITDEREVNDNVDINQRIKVDDSGQLAEVLMVCANERNIASMVNDNNVSIQGTIGVDIVFAAVDRQIKSHQLEIPFSNNFGLPDSGQWKVIEAGFNIDDVSFDISGSDSIELSIRLKIKLRVSKVEEIVCTDDLMAVKEECKKKAPIVLYFAHPEDTLWSIAKTYRVPLSRLAVENGIDASAKLEPGKRLFIM